MEEIATIFGYDQIVGSLMVWGGDDGMRDFDWTVCTMDSARDSWPS